MFGTKLAYVLLIPLLIAAGLLLQPAYTGFYAYVSGSSSGLGVWDSSDQQAGGTPAFINEPVLFYANFTDTSTSSPVTGAGVFCEIMFNVSGSWTNPDNMTYNPSTQLYEYNRSFELKGNYTWGARCDGSSGGYDDLSVNDSFHAYIHDWWNNSWKFRMGIDVSNGAYNVTDWPVEIEVNFTDVFRQMGKTHDFDENSTRLVEYNSTGYVMHELPGQFDKGFGYNETTSAHGTYVFNLNGTTESNDNRSFYLYFDALGNGPKELASYATNISYSWSGDEIHVNNTRLRFYMDTNRSENTSGLYKVYFGGSPPYIFINDYDNNRTVEYTEYSNGTYNFSFAFMDNTNVTEGPVRLTVTQYGDEFYWGSPSSLTGEGSMLKRYHIYNRGGPESTGTFIKIEQNFTNNEAYSVFRNSTLGGSTALDVVKSWTSYGGSLTAFDGNTSDPYSWYYALSSFGDLVGIINIEETDAAFYATNSTGGGRVGIHLNGTTVSSSETISEKSVIYFGKGTGQTDEFVKIRNAFSDPPSVTPGNYEPLLMESVTQTDYDSYNRNETILITVNVTYDPYNLLDTVNVTLDNATADQGDDTEIAMYDDGTNGDAQAGDLLYTNTYNVSLTEYPGTWNATAGIYDTKGNLINWSRKSFIVTDELYVNVSIVNKYGNVEREVNATVDIKNYAESVSHPGSQVNCSVFLASELIFDVNDDYIIDNGDGTYFLNFSAPSDFGHYTLRCNASKDGNDGYDTDTFDAEYIETNVSITITPGSYTLDNVTWTKNESFIIRTNSTNIANGTAYNATVSLEIPAEMSSNSTSSSCPGGNIPISESCIIDFNLTVLKTTVPSNFTVNSTISWDNANAVPGSNQTHMNATVLPTYVLSIPEDNITNTAFPGLQKNIGNITVRSYGNSPLQDVDINVTGFSSEFSFSFFPDSFASMTAGQVSPVEVYLDVDSPYPPGDYGGILNVTTSNAGYSEMYVNITVSGANMTLDVSPLNFTAGSITYYNGQSFSIDVNSTNPTNATAFASNITLGFSSPYINTSNTTPYQCGDKATSEYCQGSFVLLVSNGTPSGNYTVNVSAEWNNPDIGIRYNSTLVNISVLSNVNMTIAEDYIENNITHGTTGLIGNITVNSTGNDPVEGVQYIVEDVLQKLEDIPVSVSPNLTSFLPGQVVTINVTAAVPLSYPPGIYGGFLNVTTNNSGYRNVSIQVNVPTSKTWIVEDPSDLSCSHPESPEYGIVCNVTLNNTGNVPIDFNITPETNSSSMYNYTWTNVTEFNLENQTRYMYTIYYNVTGITPEFFNASYMVSGEGADPPWRNITVLLTPFVKPLVQVNLTPSVMPQGQTLEIKAGITDQSGVGINYTYVNVTRPDNTTYNIRMRFDYTVNNLWVYEEYYPTDPLNGTWGSSMQRGNYTVLVYTEDNLGLNSTGNNTFYSYAVMSLDMETSRASREYYQGEQGTIIFNLTDISGEPLQGANVSIEVRDPTGRKANVYNGDFLTDERGGPPYWPSFDLFSDSQTGLYNITADYTFNDTPVSRFVSNSTTTNFTVIEKKPGMMTLDVEVPSETSINDGMDIVAVVTDGVTVIDPDSVLLSLYDSLDNLILENISMTKLSTGRYTRYYNTSVSSSQGNWRWSVTISKDDDTITKDVFTRVIGGPFDVRDITINDNTIPSLSISVIIENTGDVSQDAFIIWNLTRVDNGQMVMEGMDTVMVEGLSEKTYTATPDGIDYLGDVKITFIVTYSGTEKAGAYKIFTTEEEEPSGPSPPPSGGSTGGDEGPSAGPGGAAPAGPPPKPGIAITDYPEEIATEAGWIQYPSVTVNNTGNSALHNVMVKIDGIPDSWYKTKPANVDELDAGKSRTFVFELLVPEGTDARQYYGMFNATSDEVSDEKVTSVIVFGSREELVTYLLRKLKRDFEDFREDVDAEDELGLKDLDRVYSIIDEIEHQIELTEGYLGSEMYDEALDSVTTGFRLLERGRELLRNAPASGAFTLLMIPDWMLTILLVLVIAILALVIVASRYKRKLEWIFRHKAPSVEEEQANAAQQQAAQAQPAAAQPAAPAAAAPAGPSPEEAAAAKKAAEKEKVEKVLGLLEKEFKEGIISEKAYNDLRKQNLEKLKKMG